MSIKCLVLLGLLVASATARPRRIYSLVGHPSVSHSSARSEAHSIGRSIGFGPFRIGGHLNTGSSTDYSTASAINSAGYRPQYVPAYRGIGGSHGSASAVSKARSTSYGPFSISDNTASSVAYSSASNINPAGYRGIGGSHAVASATSDARYYSPFSAGGNSARAVAHSSAINNNYIPGYGSVAQAHAKTKTQTAPQYYYVYYR